MAGVAPAQPPLLCDALLVAGRVGLDVTDPLVAGAVRRASGRFRDAVGHSVTRVDADVVYLNGGGSGVLRLPGAPVAGLFIEVDGEPLIERTDYTVDRALGLVKLKGRRMFPDDFGNVRVTYTHGYPENEVPEGIQHVVAELSEMLLNTEAGIQSRGVLGDNVAFGAAVVGSTQAWTDAVSLYGRR